MAKKGRKKREETTRVSYRLNAELEERMKQYCLDNNQVMSRWLEQAIREKLDRETK